MITVPTLSLDSHKTLGQTHGQGAAISGLKTETDAFLVYRPRICSFLPFPQLLKLCSVDQSYRRVSARYGSFQENVNAYDSKLAFQ